MTNPSRDRRPRPLARTAVMTMLVASSALVGCQRDESFADPQALTRCTQAAREALAEGAGIVLPEDVPVILLTAAEARERRRAYVASLEDGAGLTAAVDYMADAMFSDRMLGRYLPDEQAVYVIEDVLLDMGGGSQEVALELLFPVLAHELVHAYDDQVYDSVPDPAELLGVLKDPRALLDIHTRMSLLEGRASYASYLACKHAGFEPLPEPTLEQARNAVLVQSDGSVGMDMLSGFGNGLGRMKFMQYVYGWRFAERAYAYGGEPFFAHVFAHLPLSLDELEDFDLFVVRWAEELEQQLDADQQVEEPGEEAGLADDGGRAGS